MGWFGDLIKGVAGSDSKDLIFVDTLPPMLPPDTTPVPLVPDECYVTIYIESMRLEKARKFSSRFHGIVYLFARLARRGDTTIDFAAVSKPEKLAELDEHALGRIITVSKQMMGTVPWRGGDLHLELGLFSVKTGDLLTPVLDYVSKISQTAGIGFLGAVKPFVPLITDGMALISGQTGDAVMEVGTDTSVTLTGPVTCAVIAAQKGTIDVTKLSIDPFDRKLLYEGSPLQKGYCVFSVRTTDRKPDYGEIPELKQGFAAFSDAVRKGVQSEAQEALAAFRRAAIFSPDLITSDARALVAAAEEMMKDSFAAGTTSAKSWNPGGGGKPKAVSPGTEEKSKILADVKLYDEDAKPYHPVEIFYATDRAEIAKDVGVAYGPDRSGAGEMHFGRCEVTMPATHRKGRLEAPSWLRFEFKADPAKHIVLHQTLQLEIEAYLTEVAARVAASAAREAFVFVHGYNVAFDDAARRTAQIAYDLEFAGAPILYSWPSKGGTFSYLADEAEVIWTVPHLEAFLSLLAERSGAERVHIIAHSIGNRAVCDALNLMSARNAASASRPIHHLVLTAPDIDADSFSQMAEAICKTASTVTLYASSKDKALLASRAVHSHQRAGQPLLILPGIDTIDASEVDTDFLSHSYYGDARSILSDVYHLFQGDQRASQRTFDLEPQTIAAGTYYAVIP